MWVKCLTVGKGKNGNSKPLTDNYKQIRNKSLLLEPNRWQDLNNVYCTEMGIIIVTTNQILHIMKGTSV